MNRYKLYGSLLRRFLLNVYAVEGTFEGNKLRILVADDGTTLDYISRLAFPEGAQISRKGRIPALQGPGLANSDADLVVVGANRLLMKHYAERGFHVIPKWVHLFLPVNEDPYARLSSFSRKRRRYFYHKIKIAEQAGYECEVIRDKSWLPQFYDIMYKPYALQRFDEEADVCEIHILEKYLAHGYFIVSKKHGEPAAGVLVYQEGDILHIPFGGVAGGSTELMREGASFALHFHLARMAHESGCSFVDFGRSRPFLSDGTLEYKLSWHMDVHASDDIPAVFAVATPECTPQAAAFLKANPHVCIVGNECRKPGEETDE